MRQIEVIGPAAECSKQTENSTPSASCASTKSQAAEEKTSSKPTSPTRGLAWCDIHDDEVPDDWVSSPVETKVEHSPKSKRKLRKVKEAKEQHQAGKAPVQTQAQLQPAEAPQVMLGDLGLHCTAWNQATWVPPPQKAMEVMSTAPMSQPPMEKRTGSGIFLPPGAFVTSPMAGQKHLGDASSRVVCPGTSPAMQFAPEAMRFLQPGSPVAASMSPTPTACWDASCRTPVNTPMAMSWPEPVEAKKWHEGGQCTSPGGPWSPQAADTLRVLFGNAVPSGEELAARLQAAVPESYED